MIEHQTDAVLGAQQPFLDAADSLAGLRAWRDRLVAIQREHGCTGGCPLGQAVPV